MLSRSETLEFVHCRIFAAASNSRARPFTHFPEPPTSTNVLQTRNEGNPSDGRSSGKQALDAGKKEKQRTTELQTILEVGTKTTELSLAPSLLGCVPAFGKHWAWEDLLEEDWLRTSLLSYLPLIYLPTLHTFF
jgi:hypothetical protein